jgi:hypothetical protein
MIPVLPVSSALKKSSGEVQSQEQTSWRNTIVRSLWSWGSSLEPQVLSPRSYCSLLPSMLCETNLDAVQLFLIRAMRSLPVERLGVSSDFLTVLKKTSTLLHDNPKKFRELLVGTRPEFYYLYPSLCQNETQVEIMVDVACENAEKLDGIINQILHHIGDPRDGEELKRLYLFCLEKIIQKKDSDEVIVKCLIAHRDDIEEDQIRALQELKNSPGVQKVIAENLQRA